MENYGERGIREMRERANKREASKILWTVRVSLFSVIPRLPSKAKFLFLPYDCEIRK